jgi:hypothetical protein
MKILEGLREHVLPKARKGQAKVDKAFQRAIKT